MAYEFLSTGVYVRFLDSIMEAFNKSISHLAICGLSSTDLIDICVTSTRPPLLGSYTCKYLVEQVTPFIMITEILEISQYIECRNFPT